MSKTKITAIALCGVLIVATASPALLAAEPPAQPTAQKMESEAKKAAETPAPKDMSVVGEVVDMGCYMAHPATGKGPGHKECAMACVKGGMPIGLLTDDGKLFVLLPPHEGTEGYVKLHELVAERVTVNGTVMMSAGVNAITVKSAEKAPAATKS